MLRPYDFSLRVDNAPTSPLIEAVYFYTEMVIGLKNPAPHSGLVRLYQLQSGGVDMAGVACEIAPFAVTPAAARMPAISTVTAAGASAYLGLMIESNVKAWVDILVSQIRRRLASWNSYSADDASYVPDYVSPDWAKSNFFSPSESAIGYMRALERLIRKELPPILRAQEMGSAVDQLDWQLSIDLDRQIKAGGRGSVSELPVVDIEKFIVTTYAILDQSTGSCLYAGKLLRTLLNITRLLFGQVKPIAQDQEIRDSGDCVNEVRISDETLLCLPAPTRALAQSFAEPEVSFISRLGALYLLSLEKAYTRC